MIQEHDAHTHADQEIAKIAIGSKISGFAERITLLSVFAGRLTNAKEIER